MSALLYVERITPACAGRTRLSSGIGMRISDHPRVRGENLS